MTRISRRPFHRHAVDCSNYSGKLLGICFLKDGYTNRIIETLSCFLQLKGRLTSLLLTNTSISLTVRTIDTVVLKVITVVLTF